MQTETVLYVVSVGIIALFLASFQYYKKEKSMSKLNMLFSFLRFITVFSVLLLLINPRFEQIKLTVEKPNLIIAVDNSSSIKYLKQDLITTDFVYNLMNNKALNEKFNLKYYTFGESLKVSDSLSFTEKQTNIFDAFSQLNQVYKQTISPTILISDGNQTYGNDYQFIANSFKQPIYPIILGDTISYEDLKIEQLNVNKYAYLKNKFPVEVILVYNGNENNTSDFVVKKGNVTVYSQSVNFTKDINSKVLNFTLPTNSIGISNYNAFIIPLKNEKNVVNNSKNFAVEIIDQKTKIAIVSEFYHPDLGVLKKSIESNEQHSVQFLNSNEIISQINDYQLVILYQPNNLFKQIFELLEMQNRNKFVIIGSKTDLEFINKVNDDFDFEITNQTENYQAELNKSYAPFLVDDINFESFPPLVSNYGSVIFSKPIETILNKTLNGISTNDPLLFTFESNGTREAVLLGENIWLWRAQSYMNSKSFNEFDDFLGKLVQYLASNKQKSRLNIDYESFYYGSSKIVIKAEFFDKNYVFDTRETLNITLVDNVSKEQKVLPLTLKNNNYQVDLSSLKPSSYTFTIKASNENLSNSGSFQILQYEVEQQFLSANVTKMKQLATNSCGTTFFIDNTKDLSSALINDNRFTSIQKSSKNTIPLIDWKYLLTIIALSLGIEWFLRKYNGLI